MYIFGWGLLATAYFVLLGNHRTEARVTLLLESPVQPKNVSKLFSKVEEATQSENVRVTEKIILTKDKGVPDAWRTEKGDLVELKYIKAEPKPSVTERISSIPIADGSDQSPRNFVPAIGVQYVAGSQNSIDDFSGTRTSHRMKRTFWPFTNMFGYDYPPPPPPPYGLFGPQFSPPFGGGFGLGYPGPFGPPPPLFGFNMGF